MKICARWRRGKGSCQPCRLNEQVRTFDVLIVPDVLLQICNIVKYVVEGNYTFQTNLYILLEQTCYELRNLYCSFICRLINNKKLNYFLVSSFLYILILNFPGGFPDDICYDIRDVDIKITKSFLRKNSRKVCTVVTEKYVLLFFTNCLYGKVELYKEII